MPRARSASAGPASAPLLMWEELRALEALRAERAALIESLSRLPRHSRRHVLAEARLAALTARLLAAELDVSRDGANRKD